MLVGLILIMFNRNMKCAYIKKLKKSVLSRQNCRKSSVEECIFGYMALYIKCRFNKKSLLRSYFLAIFPAGMYYAFKIKI